MELKEIPPDRAVVLKNVTCPFCGAEFGTSGSTREHLVGRRFVPKGTLNQSWNLILRACITCNNRKSDLEDDLSALTMQPDAAGRYALSDQNLALEAVRKGSKSVSRSTKRPISKSRESLSFEGSLMPGITVKFTTVGPPRAEPERVFELARLQLSGLFYWITFHTDQRKGGGWLGGCFPLQYTFRADWGNSLNVEFMNTVANWDRRLLVATAGDFFKASIKRHPEVACWSWSLEWNHNLRLIGFLGDETVAQDIANSFSPLERHNITSKEGEEWLFRTETQLAPENDILFS